MKDEYKHGIELKCRVCEDVIFSHFLGEEVHCSCGAIGIMECIPGCIILGDSDKAIIRDVRDKPGYKAEFNNELSNIKKERIRKLLQDSGTVWLNYAIPNIVIGKGYLLSEGIDLLDGTGTISNQLYKKIINYIPSFKRYRILYIFACHRSIVTSTLIKQEEVGDSIKLTTRNSVYVFNKIR
ncbi:MAG: hypothetical protein ABFC94_00165 [Syntrophomonas sp.]